MQFSCICAKKAVLLQPISSRDGGIGRHEGLKILWPVMAVRVQVPLAVLNKKAKSHELTRMGFCFFICKWRKGLTQEVPLAVLNKKILHMHLRMCNIFCTFAPKLTKTNFYVLHL